MRHAKIPYSKKHPIILDCKNYVTKLIIEQAHNNCRRLGSEFVRAHMQRDFIITGLRRFLKQLSKPCFVSRGWRAQNITPLMTDLPSFRFAEAEKHYLFLNVGLEFFGPFYIEHRNRKLEKQYVCLFTSLVTRAVHLEICQTMDTDSCLLAIRRFVSRRGYPEVSISDNGSNFTSAKKMLNLNKISVDNNYIKSQLQQQNITWEVNPPRASHFGGIWERLIQSAQRTLLIIIGSLQLKAEIFQTIVAETEGLLNSSPITYVSSDTNDEEALTPCHFLLRRPDSRFAPLTSTSRIFSKKDFSYTHTHTLLDHFLKRLQKEYTSDVISRPK